MRVELFGIPRERAGVASVDLDAATLGQLVTALSTRFPGIRDLVTPSGFCPTVVANLNGDRFIQDPGTPIEEGDCVLVLSADAGG